MLFESLGSTIIDEILSDFGKPILIQFNPPSVDLYIPSPTETLFLVQVSPVPAQITLSGLLGSKVITPIDWMCLSKTGTKDAPPSELFQIPPPAAPKKII